ncbi:MAG TPA: sulfurtransferase TusE, partial [Pseudomonas sp.]|nr:sulfurtransferase TusE [Pseudomonas sp.]
MNTLDIEGKAIALDKDGFLVNLEDWSPATAQGLATREGI